MRLGLVTCTTAMLVRRLRWPLAALAAAAVALLLPAAAWAPIFSGGPSVSVTPDVQVEFAWNTDVAWFGKVEVFTNPDGTGTPVLAERSLDPNGAPIAAAQQVITVPVSSPLAPDTTYYFRLTATDPSNNLPDVVTPTPLPPFFTGTQALSNVQVTPGLTSAQISWQANAIGFGRVEYGPTSSYGQTVEDAQNVTDHSLTLTGLQPATTYYFRVSNRHAIDGDSLASSTGSLTTLSTFSDQFLQPLTQSTDPAKPVINTGRNGKVIPVKVLISESATALTDLNTPGPVTIALSKLASCSTSAGTDPITSYADAGQSSAGTSQFHYDTLVQAWTYNLDTKALGLVTGNCYRIDVAVNGTQIANAFAVFQPTK
jgi:hypothetical protein